jgi:hypothetical protein
MSERDTQRADPEVGRCHVCGQTFDSQVDLSKHLLDAAHDAARDEHVGLNDR